MSQFVETPTKTFEADGAIAQYARAKMGSNGKVTACSATEQADGTVEQAAFAAGDKVALRLLSAQGTRKMIASGAITAGDTVYAAASGKVASTGSVVEGKAVDAAGANGDIIEVMPTNLSAVAQVTNSATTATAFEVDIDGTTPRVAISGDTGGTGDFTATIKPPTTLTADRTFTLVGDANATLVNVATAQTLTNKTLTAPILGVATGTSLAVTGALTSSSPSAGIGYATGAGSTVTQITSRSTGVTINALCGTITTDTTSLAAESSADFIVTNTSVAINDVIILNIRSGENSGGTVLSVQDVAAGSFAIRVHNGNAAGGTAETGAIVINFAVLKAVVA